MYTCGVHVPCMPSCMSRACPHACAMEQASVEMEEDEGDLPTDMEIATPPHKSGKGIRWHEGNLFTHEFDDSHLWLHGNPDLQIWILRCSLDNKWDFGILWVCVSVHLYLYPDPKETAKDMTDRYKSECASNRVRPIAKLLEQLEVSPCLFVTLCQVSLELLIIVPALGFPQYPHRHSGPQR